MAHQDLVYFNLGPLNGVVGSFVYKRFGKNKDLLVLHPFPKKHKTVVRELVRRLRAVPDAPVMFHDIALILEYELEHNLIWQSAHEAFGTIDWGQWVAADTSYRELASDAQYACVFTQKPPEPFDELSYFLCEDLVHDALHLLFFAQQRRGTVKYDNTLVAEEFSVIWWVQKIVTTIFPWVPMHAMVNVQQHFYFSFPEESRLALWERGTVFEVYASQQPWIPPVLAALPQRDVYITERPDAEQVWEELKSYPPAKFLVERGPMDCRIHTLESVPA